MKRRREEEIALEENVQKLVDYMEPKPKNLIVVTGRGSKLQTTFNPPLEYPITSSIGYEMSLLRLETYFSFPNIDAKNNHFLVSTDDGKTWLEFVIPIGCYDIKSINSVLQRLYMERTGKKEKEKRFVIEPNKNTLRCVLEVCDDKTIVNFDIENSLCSVLGFERKSYKRGRFESENLVNILSVNSILVHCDVVGASCVNGVEAPVIYNFFPDVSPGEKIVSQPLHLIYLPLTMNIISRMTSWLTDQNGREFMVDKISF